MATKSRSKRKPKAPSETTVAKLREDFERWSRRRGLKRSNQRFAVVEVFLRTTNHVSCEDVYNIVKRADLKIGYSTVYRTLKLLAAAGMAREVNFGDGVTRYDHTYNFSFKNHYHLVCIGCGETTEFTSSAIDRSQKQVAGKNGFDSQHHKLEVYGMCRRCKDIE